GIRHEKTPPKTPQLNGLVERMNRTLIERDEYGYKLYDPVEKKLDISCDVQFMEEQTIEDIDKFPEKFFPASRTVTIRKEIYGIRQHSGETLHEYWERFNKLCATCPHHQISEQLLIQYFYEGMTIMDRSMIDAASGGALMDKTPTTTRHLISNMANYT
ncbi:hypothetical protein CR513_03460, partial [Mucuna pruriens]